MMTLHGFWNINMSGGYFFKTGLKQGTDKKINKRGNMYKEDIYMYIIYTGYFPF